MLKRLYVHNYKCLVNFEINFDQDISLFLGANGSGKTSVLMALYEIQKFITKNDRLDDKDNDIFKLTTITRWRDDVIQKFELDIEGNEGIYKYVLEIEHQLDKKLRRVKTESLFFNNQPLFKFSIEQINGEWISNGKLFNDSQTNNEGVPYPFEWSRSALGSVQDRKENKKLTWFKNWLKRLFISHIYPNTMNVDMKDEESHPELDLSNYVAWLNHWNNENREGVNQVEQELKEIIEGFSSFKFSQFGLKKLLEVKINKIFYRFDELSDGQKTLAALYTLIYCIPDNSIICIDEPENFLALPEIQPWFDTLYEQCSERNLQGILISHHPKIINFLASDSGYWFSRDNNLTRVQKIVPENESGLSIAELIERGWIDGY
ncbi:MAG: ATP-binding cassette domain-containing protein [Methylococcales bacterium]|nr:ATP-binding cassette domain-containing protein [Methylococcales bacterium]